MGSILDPLSVGQSVGDRLSAMPQADDDGTAVDCKKSVNVLPLRYSAVYGEDDDSAAFASVPEYQGEPVAGIGLSQAKYTARFLREGYLYVLVNRLGTYRWEHCYYVSADALLTRINPYEPTKESGGINYFSIDDVEDVPEAYMLFLPDPLSVRMLERLKSEARLRESLQRFAIAELAHSCSGESVIPPTMLQSEVAEFVGYQDEGVGHLLQKQAFPSLTDPFEENAQPADLTNYGSRFDSLQRALDGLQGFAVVLGDAIGITQELNNHRNDALEPLRDWMEKKDADGLTNEQRFYTAELIRDLRENYVKGRVNAFAQRDVMSFRSRAGLRYMPHVRAVGEAEIGGNSQPTARDYELAEEYEERQAEILESSSQRITVERGAEFRQEYDSQYAPLLDQNARQAFDDRMAEQSRRQEALMAPRVSDHLAWLRGAPFLDALDYYDSRDPIWGWAYSIQVVQATVGMEGTEAGAALLDQWWRDMNMNDRSNLAWAVYCLNQYDIRRAGQQDIDAFRAKDAKVADAEDDSWIGPEPQNILQGFKQLIAAFNTANAALEGETPDWFRSKQLGVTMAWYTQFMKGFFEKARSETMDRATLRISLGLMRAQLARHAAQIGVNRRWFSKGSARELAKAKRFLSRDMQAALEGNGSQFMQFRLGVAVAIIESYALYQTLSKQDKDSRDYAKIAGAFVVVAGSIADTAASSINMVMVMGKYRATDVGEAARFQLGGFSFWGGMLASVGALFSAIDDYIEASRQFEQRHLILFMAYGARFLANVGIAILGTAVTLASSAAFLSRVAQQGKTALARQLASLLAPLARSLATAAIRGVLLAGFAVASWAGIILTIGFWIFGDDALEAWCKRCVFTTEGDPDYYADYAEEVGVFHQALQDVT
ncbi:T6SS effector BTH_I2691 family protein [uncultured Salinicola sp.]|uniref:T6SS effector BTH_I2691 family protein n=1 Tax=uncultured Salinicola sp. TaxID=1193542 RepID=UPI002621AFEC|nr:T6SS effector BTH_I2691 family protein [uncultured Salinicola sp.]